MSLKTFLKVNVGKILLACIMLFPVIALATTAADSFGKAGDLISQAIKDPQALEMVAGILTLLIPMIYRFLQWGLKKLQVRYKWANNKLVVGFFWKLAAFLFGRSILMYNSTVDTAGLTANEKQIAEQAHLAKLKQHFLKHDPVLSIDIKKGS